MAGVGREGESKGRVLLGVDALDIINT